MTTLKILIAILIVLYLGWLCLVQKDSFTLHFTSGLGIAFILRFVIDPFSDE